MKTDEMTPQWVVKNFLPGYESRLEHFHEWNKKGNNFRVQTFFDAHFPEALAELLKAQREVCACIVLDNEQGGYCEPQTTSYRVRQAPIPEPKNKQDNE